MNDRVGFLITDNEANFDSYKPKKIQEDVMAIPVSGSRLKPVDKTSTHTGKAGLSMQMTSVLSNSKIVTLNENLARDYTRKNLVKHKVRAKWVPNEHVAECFHCRKGFGLIRWRHHCRECGNIFCGFCCSQYDFASGFQDQKVRI
mmetsp:Transcript_17325/g.20083  ORF Transcript_17325/g.20083 Transcript_17325/m.20083 type:complete len:145 (-) Transcript_17325:142-576(-)